MRISDWSSDVCSSDLPGRRAAVPRQNLCFFKVHVHRMRPGGTGIAVTPDFGGSLLRECRRDGRVHELAIDRPQAHVMVEYPLALGHHFAEVNLGEGDRKSTRLNSSH